MASGGPEAKKQKAGTDSAFANMKLVDAHHHFLDPEQPHHAYLKELGAPAYTTEQYAAETRDLPFSASVHVSFSCNGEARSADLGLSSADLGLSSADFQVRR